MTGSVRVEGVKAAEYQRAKKDDGDWPPRFWKLQFEMDNGARISFNDGRRFARAKLVKDPTTVPPISKLGGCFASSCRYFSARKASDGSRTWCTSLAPPFSPREVMPSVNTHWYIALHAHHPLHPAYRVQWVSNKPASHNSTGCSTPKRAAQQDTVQHGKSIRVTWRYGPC